MTDIPGYVSCMFEMDIFKIPLVFSEHIRVAFQSRIMDFALKHKTARFPSIVSSSDLPVVQYTKTESNIA